VGQAYLKGRQESQGSPVSAGIMFTSHSPFTKWSESDQTTTDNSGPLKRTRSTDVYWSGGRLPTPKNTPSHLLGMTPNPDFTVHVRHTRSLSLGDSPVIQSQPAPSDKDKEPFECEEITNLDIDDIIEGI
jgi:hypothetical protein